MAFVELHDVTLDYASNQSVTRAIENVTLSIQRGEFVAIAGPSGCGKTTILKLVAGLLSPTVGSVVVDGTVVRGPLKIVGMAFQNPTLLPWRTTLENILLPLEIVEPHKRAYRQDARPYIQAARDLLKTVGLDGFADRHPWQLSGGMQQRASLCRALIHEPQILLLDEPFGALDAFTREELWGVLQTLWQKRQCTVILVTHDLREAVYLANTVYVMSRRPGRLISCTVIDLPRPRTLEDTFRPEFTEYVHEIRRQITEALA
ncbi:MAG: ABC transporter ATP-binding protein [Anaerolineae bacterium]|nr:ABC transporter ATP-binding protein [Anaerolineae bacterium]